jgi:hypothetical protein
MYMKWGIQNMAEIKPGKIKVKGLTKVALVVEDLPVVMESYWNILGIGPWNVYVWEPPMAYERNYHGRPAWGREKIAIAQVGGVQLELIQPIDGNSIYSDHLVKRGEGLHHIQLLVDDVHEATEILTREGYLSRQSECIGELSYNSIEVEPLHCICELASTRGIIHEERTRYPDLAQESPAKVMVKDISQVALCVADVQKTLECYWNILGIGPWDVITAVPPALYKTTYHGSPREYTFKIAITQIGATQLELMQPLTGESVHADVLREQGEGLHHMQFQVEDINETTRIMDRGGFRTLASGGYTDGGFAFYDTAKSLKCVWEALQVPKQMSVDYRWPG